MSDVKDASQHIDIDWYRVPIDKETLQKLNQRSDLKGFLQSYSFIGLLLLTGGLALYGVGNWPWWVVLAIVFMHGTFCHFMLNGVHELSHGSVFKTKWLNQVTMKILGVMGLHNDIIFQQSHRRHHRYTLHDPYDSEVVLPIRYELISMLKSLFVDWRAWWIYKDYWRVATGHLDNPWHQKIFPESNPELRKQLFNYARITLAVHAFFIIAGIVLGLTVHPRWFLLPVLTTLHRFYGRWLNFLLNDTQHVGLSDHVPDFRLCARSIKINPFFGFLYWQMQYHIEHHMYAAVPFYNLPKLNKLVKDQLPEPPKGVIATWLHIAECLKKQKEDPEFKYVPELPADKAA